MSFWLILLYSINTVLILAALWLSWKAIKAGFLMTNQHFGDIEKQVELRWVIMRTLLYLGLLGLIAAIFNIFFI